MDQSSSVDKSHSGDAKQNEEDEKDSPPPKKELGTKASMMIVMVEHDDTDDEDEDDIPRELDQATLSRMCMLPEEIVLREKARRLSEISMKEAQAEAFLEDETKRMSLIAVYSAFSAAVSEEIRQAKRKPKFFRRVFSCCFSCFGRRRR
ncbi:uncharacterized protein LOC134253645 [Saccostrea cucullata]|uniref:uncharacterized protein LOC134253645 n=1 Tax=Saccostrea cuccullata TaxID=36930 RepID=UPI002ED09921